MRRSARRLTWSAEELAHACDLVVKGLEDRTPFAGNPAFIEAMQTTANLLRGNGDNVRHVGFSSRRDGLYLMIKVKEIESE